MVSKNSKEHFFPKCLSATSSAMKALGHSASGHILPCCWCDNSDPGFEFLLTDELKIENNDSISDIINSKPWMSFARRLENGGKGLPYTCWKYCGKGKEHNTRKKEKLNDS